MEVAVGDPREVLQEKVVEHNADFLFLGRRGQGWLFRLFFDDFVSSFDLVVCTQDA